MNKLPLHLQHGGTNFYGNCSCFDLVILHSQLQVYYFKKLFSELKGKGHACNDLSKVSWLEAICIVRNRLVYLSVAVHASYYMCTNCEHMESIQLCLELLLCRCFTEVGHLCLELLRCLELLYEAHLKSPIISIIAYHLP